MSKSDTNPPQNNYTILNWFITSVVGTVVMAFVVVARHEFMNINHPATILLAPLLAGFCLALGNYRHLQRSALLLLPLSFGLSLLVCFAGLFLAKDGQAGGQFIWLDILVENVPVFFGSWLLYRIYAALSGGTRALVFLLVLLFFQACAFALYRDYDVIKLEAIFYAGSIAALSLNHLGKKAEAKPQA